jgi:hypothetical protein
MDTVKGFLSFAIVIGLILVGPSPVSLCALASSLVADCESMDKPSTCDQMEMQTHPSGTWKVRTISCCAMSQAPLPEGKNELSNPAPAQELATVSILSAEAMHRDRQALTDLLTELSPPPLRSLLCTFLL